MKRVFILLFVLALAFPANAFAAPAIAPSYSVTVPGGPTFWVHDVVRDDSIVLQITGYPKGDERYEVQMGRIGDLFEPIGVGELTGNDGAEFRKTFKIPARLHGQNLLTIQVVSREDGSRGYDIFANETGWNTNKLFTLSPVAQSSAQDAGSSVNIFQGPSFWVSNVDVSGSVTQVTLKVSNYDGLDKYRIVAGANDSTFEALPVGLLDDSYPREFRLTFPMPTGLWDEDEIMIRMINTHNGNSGTTAVTIEKDWKVITPHGQYTTTYFDLAAQSKEPKTGAPSTKVLNVVKDTEVTLQLFNMAPEKEFLVTMGPIGTQGIGGFVVGTQTTGEGGSFIVTYPIPAQLQGEALISIRLQSTSSGHYAYDYFANEDGYNAVTGGTSTTNPNWVLPAGTYPSFEIVSVVVDSKVSITGVNFTKDDIYTVRLGLYGSEGVGGFIVGTIETGDQSAFSATFDIPESLRGLDMIAIRLESQNADYYAFNFFYNR
ncbi:MAG: hypothetical protein EPO32_02410 [Anaerolineae bacterium]|nr:MAG: hypothetical protein EPO32_02410 [Anaerolineae bacterium]